jgi:putative DNA primase/helicase
VREASGYPVWATVSAVGLERVLVPEGVGRVLIAADHDRAGVEAAYALGERLFLQGLRVSLIFPEEDGMDWLDVLKGAKEEGLSAR